MWSSGSASGTAPTEALAGAKVLGRRAGDFFKDHSNTSWSMKRSRGLRRRCDAGGLHRCGARVVYKAQRTLLGSLIQSIGLAFVLIAIVMIVLLNPARRPRECCLRPICGSGIMAGMISMIPNMFPVLLVFGLMGHFGRLVDIGTMMTASVAMGVAVDDTIHFLSWFRSYLDRGYDRIKAIQMTYRRVGPAMTQTTIVGGLGLFVFALSTFTPTQRLER